MKIRWLSLTAALLALAVARQTAFAQGTAAQTAPAPAPSAPSAAYAAPAFLPPGPVAAPPDAFAAPAGSTWGSYGPACPNERPRFFTPFMVVDVTLGSTFEFSNRATLGTSFVVPLTGPKPFDFKVIA